MSSLFAWRALLFAGECLLASAVLPLLALAVTSVVKQASIRHLIWMTAFGAMIVLPLAALILPAQFLLERHVVMLPPEPASTASLMVAAPVAAPSPEIDMGIVAGTLFVLWLAGFVWAAFRLALGAFGLHLLWRKSRPHSLSPADLPRHDARRRECELRLSNAQDGPITWGVFQPVILLPKKSLYWSRERLHAVLLHELAHVRRRDSFTQSAALLICAVYWLNPLVWLAARALRREAEMAADDAVIRSGFRPSTYAGQLLQLSWEFRGQHAAGVAMAQSSLETRVKSVLAPNQSRKGATVMDMWKIAGLGLAVTSALALMRPDMVDAQDAAPPQTAVSPAPVVQPLPPVQSLPPVSELPAPPPPAVADAPAPPAPPHHAHRIIVEDDSSNSGDGHSVVIRERRTKDGLVIERSDHLSAQDKAEIDAQVRAAKEAMRQVEPEIRKAIAAAKIDEATAHAMAAARPRIEIEIHRAMANMEPEIRHAIAEAHISEKVARAMEKAQPDIDRAIARAQVKMDKKMRVIEEEDRSDETRDDTQVAPSADTAPASH